MPATLDGRTGVTESPGPAQRPLAPGRSEEDRSGEAARSGSRSHLRRAQATFADMSDSPPENPALDLGFARLDVERAHRTGDPEVVYGAGKTPAQVVELLTRLHEAHPDRCVLATRLSDERSSLSGSSSRAR